MAEAQANRRQHSTKSKLKRKKLPRLPQNAKVEKRPLLRPAIPSPYAGASQQKVVYISTHTPFLSAVKRVEKLLHLADKRLVQSATTNAQQQGGRGGKRKRGADGDEIVGIAEEVERLKDAKRKKVGGGVIEEGEDGTSAGEEVVLKGTGKAIHRVLELALWFQQREQEYVVRLKTGSAGAIDDISVEEDGVGPDRQDLEQKGDEDVEAGAEKEDAMDVDGAEKDEPKQTKPAADVDSEQHNGDGVDASERKKKRKRKREGTTLTSDEVPETRVRYASVLEAYVSLR